MRIRVKEGGGEDSEQEERMWGKEEKEETTKRLEEEVENVTALVASLEKQYAGLEKQYNDAEQSLVDERTKAENKLEAQRRENKNIMLKEQQDSGVAQLEKQVGDLTNEVANLKSDMEAKAFQYSSQSTRLAEVSKNLSNLATKHQEFVRESEGEISKLKKAAEEANKKAQDITQATNKAIDECSNEKRIIQEQEQKKKVTLEEITSFEERCATAKEKKATLTEQGVTLKREELRMLGEIKKIESSLASKKEEETKRLTTLQTKEKKLKDELKRKQEDQALVEKQYKAQLDKEVADAQMAASKSYKEELKDEQRALEEARSDNEQLRIRIKALEKQLNAERKKKRDTMNMSSAAA